MLEEFSRNKMWGQLFEIVKLYGEIQDNTAFHTVSQGNINDTYIVNLKGQKIVVQRINPQVFPWPERVAENFAAISFFLQNRLSAKERATFPQIIPTLTGENHVISGDGAIWRAQKYFENSISYPNIDTTVLAVQVGRILARFHNIFQDMSPQKLEVPLPGFHDLSLYLQKYDNALRNYPLELSEQIKRCNEFIFDNRDLAEIVRKVSSTGEPEIAIVHGDPKVANVLFSRGSGEAITLIDYDTVGPGLYLCDIGDCLRSCCTVDENRFDVAVHCDVEMVAALLQGYNYEREMNSKEKALVFEFFFLITFELGLRFLTDFLEGNNYFKVTGEEDNLHRARVQFELAANILTQEKIIKQLVEKLQ